MTEITQNDLAPLLPDGATIKSVADRDGKPVINVSDALGDWQAAVPVGDDVEATKEQVVIAAWTQELHMRHSLLIAEVREEYQATLSGLWEQLQAEKRGLAENKKRPGEIA